MIDPSIWQDENFGQLSMCARLLFIGLFSNADDEGKIRANDSYIRSTIFMYDDIALADVRQAVDEVATKVRSIELYEIDGNRYIQLKKWSEYQKQREERIQKSILPSPIRHMSDKCQTDDSTSSLDKCSLDKNKLGESKREGISPADGGVGKQKFEERRKALHL